MKNGGIGVRKIGIITGLCLAMMISGCKSDSNNYMATSNLIEEAEKIEVYGEVTVEESKEINIDFPAVVKKIHVKDGQKIKKGDPLIELDFKDYIVQIEMKENEIKIYETQLRQLKENINPIGVEIERIKEELAIKRNYLETNTDPDIDILQRNLEMVNKEVEDITKDYEKSKELFNLGAISEHELKNYEKTVQLKEKEQKDITTKIDQIKTNKQLEISALSSQLKSNERQLTNTDKNQVADIEQLHIRMDLAKLELDQMKNKIDKAYLQDHTIIAEEEGLLVYDIHCIEGSKVGEFVGPILKVMRLDTLVITIDIPEEYVEEVAIGKKVEIELYGDQSADVNGKIVRISDRAIEKNGETIILAYVAIEQGKEILRPGLSVDASIILQ